MLVPSHGLAAALTIVLVLAATALAADSPAPADAQALVQSLQASSPETRMDAAQLAGPLGATAIAPVGALLKGTTGEPDRAIIQALTSIVTYAGRPGSDAEADRVAEELLALTAPDYPAPARQAVIELLALIATDEQVPALGKLLTDSTVAESARRALDRIPSPKATQCLISALDTVPEPLRVEVVDSLGKRGDPAAEAPLRARLDDSDAMKWAVLTALAHLGIPPTQVFPLPRDASPDQARQYEFALVAAADAQAQSGNLQAAEGLYLAVATNSNKSQMLCIALRGLSQTRSEHFVRQAIGLLSQPNAGRVAADLLTESEVPGIDNRLASAWPQLSPTVQVMVLNILAKRNAPELSATLARAKDSEDPAVRVAAARLANSDPAMSDLLALVAQAAADGESDTVRNMLKDALARVAPDNRDAVCQTLDTLIAQAYSDDVKKLALAGLQQLAPESSLESVKKLLDDRTLGAAAGCAYAAIARAHAAPAEAKEVLRVLAARSPYPEVVRCATEQLRSLGVETTDIALRRGYIPVWRMLGPFPVATERGTPLPKGTDLNTSAPCDYQGTTYTWVPVTLTDVPPTFDLQQHYGKLGAAYAATTLESADSLPCSVYVDVPGPYAVWLNGRLLLPASEEGAPLKGALAKGTNQLLIRCEASDSAWRFTVRLTDRKGMDLDLTGETAHPKEPTVKVFRDLLEKEKGASS